MWGDIRPPLYVRWHKAPILCERLQIPLFMWCDMRLPLLPPPPTQPFMWCDIWDIHLSEMIYTNPTLGEVTWDPHFVWGDIHDMVVSASSSKSIMFKFWHRKLIRKLMKSYAYLMPGLWFKCLTFFVNSKKIRLRWPFRSFIKDPTVMEIIKSRYITYALPVLLLSTSTGWQISL